ncbi:protein induced by osmotic stress [Scheffersomyces amazonensis]|uniref:protein induced by osmotic stress n=1 Tax=Scheffersomyces amazonensis TaxID=1078765 RepID=UPI00315D276C
MSAQTVFVSGANGYIAQHTVVQLLKKGYNVVGQVRSAAKGDALAKDLKNSHFSYEVVEVLEQEGAFDEALTKHPEVTVFLHTASPATFSAEDNERDVIIPAVNGTKNVLKSIKKVAPQIKKVVVTSSAVAAGSLAQLEDPKFVGGEDTWNPITYEEAVKGDPVAAYQGSKKFAELAAWDFVKAEKPNFKLTTVLPVYVFGPQAFRSGLKSLNLTAQVIIDVFKLKKNDSIPALESLFADVRDVAYSHIAAFENESAEGKRLLVVSGRFNYQNVVDIVRKNFVYIPGQLPVGTPASKDIFDHYKKLNDSNAREVVGIEYIPFEKTIIDQIKQYLVEIYRLL